MKKTTDVYSTWDKSFRASLYNGKLITSSTVPHVQDMDYQGKGKPYACQAKRQKLLLGNRKDVMFGIKKIRHSYGDWTGDIFKDYEIEIICGNKEDVRNCFYDCVKSCDECYGCGDW